MYAAIYARHSTDRQSHSTRDQIDRCIQFCKKAGYEIADIFSDEAISGAHMHNRPGIRNMISAALEGRFTRIVTEDLSRISRDQGDMAGFFKKISFLDIALETVAEGHINELHIGLKSTMNALYLKDLADKTHRGMVASVLKGAVPGGQTYGYDIVHQLDERGEPIRGLRSINAIGADVIRQIFADYDKGKSLKRICADLNAKGIPAPKGGRWVQTTLVGTAARKTGLLRQTLYKGVVTFNRMAYRKHPDTGKRLSVVRPESEWIQVPVPELAILEDSLFDRVQKLLDERSSTRRRQIVDNKVRTEKEKAERSAAQHRAWRSNQYRERQWTYFLFSGKLFCAEHGEKITQYRSKIYNCPVKGCPNRYLHFSDLMPMVLSAAEKFDRTALLGYLRSPEVKSQVKSLQDAITTKKAQQEKLRSEVGVVISALAEQPRKSEIRSYFDRMEMKIRRLQLDIERHEKNLQLLKPENALKALDRYCELLKKLRRDYEDADTINSLRPTISRFELRSAWLKKRSGSIDRTNAIFDYKRLLTMGFTQ